MQPGIFALPFVLVLGLVASLEDARTAASASAACPADCDSCDEGICKIECAAGSSCAQQTVTCPSGMDCAVECAGDAACRSATIVGPRDHELAVECDGAKSCDAAVLDSGLDLELSCKGDDACSNATLYCSSGTCDWACVTSGSCDDIAVE